MQSLKEQHQVALDHIEAGNWEAAHKIVQDSMDKLSCLIHAYLHREEGDTWNAGYWYRQAGEKFPDNSLGEELIRLRRMAHES